MSPFSFSSARRSRKGVARFEGTFSSDIRTLSMWLYTVDGVATGASVVPALPIVFALGCLHRFLNR